MLSKHGKLSKCLVTIQQMSNLTKIRFKDFELTFELSR